MSFKTFQGTDGVRAIVKLSSDPLVATLTPQDAFLEKGVMTEEFVELYIYSRIKSLIDNSVMKSGDAVVIGWDTRDKEGVFNQAAISGAVKGGAKVLVAGIVPTPAIPLYMMDQGATAGFMITASHNIAKYNGIKIFTRHGFKLLPVDDQNLSELVNKTDYSTIKNRAISNNAILDKSYEVKEFFVQLMINRANSQIDSSDDFSSFYIVLDSANGAASMIAEEIFKRAGVKNIVAINNNPEGIINHNSGAADLAGITTITRDDVKANGRFEEYSAIQKIFELADLKQEELANHSSYLFGGIFDGDGDRFYRLDYLPESDSLLVLNGDDITITQAPLLIEKFGQTSDTPFAIFTIESDIELANSLSSYGVASKVVGVGDKWILYLAIKDQLQHFLPSADYRSIEHVLKSSLSVDTIEQKLVEIQQNNYANSEVSTLKLGITDFLIGSEESGHTITPTYIRGNFCSFAGNGIKSGLNTFKAKLDQIKNEKSNQQNYNVGVKQSLPIFYVDKSKFKRDEKIWINSFKKVKEDITSLIQATEVAEIKKDEDPDMLFIELTKSSKKIGTIFIRNSGTEDKTTVNVRAVKKFASQLDLIAKKLHLYLIKNLKDRRKKIVQAEFEFIKLADERKIIEIPFGTFTQNEYHDLIRDMRKEELLNITKSDITLSPHGAMLYDILE